MAGRPDHAVAPSSEERIEDRFPSSRVDTRRIGQHAVEVEDCGVEVASAYRDEVDKHLFLARGALPLEQGRHDVQAGAHHHYGTVRLAQNVLQGHRARGFPYSSPGEDDEVRGLLFGQA